jgi:2-polyprenyl-3-methyl-5-hydroxy-6-metoxy-1,4-benzoquinol methylase
VVTARNPHALVTHPETTTTYTVNLIERILAVKGSVWLCDEIEREENPGYLQNVLGWTVHGFLAEENLCGRRVLDFGCGAGASTMILARLFSGTDFVGLDIDRAALGIADARRAHYGRANVSFEELPSATELPADLGEFDVVVFSAVFEHMLPAERQTMIPKVFSTLRPGGLLLVGETPHRFSPIETHTTGGTPLLNYFPRSLALRVARRRPKVWPGATWEGLLRAGIRGGSPGEFMGILRRAGHDDARLSESFAHPDVADEFDLWYQISRVNELPGLKARLRSAFRLLKWATGVSFTPYLAFAVERVPRA